MRNLKRAFFTSVILAICSLFVISCKVKKNTKNGRRNKEKISTDSKDKVAPKSIGESEKKKTIDQAQVPHKASFYILIPTDASLKKNIKDKIKLIDKDYSLIVDFSEAQINGLSYQLAKFVSDSLNYIYESLNNKKIYLSGHYTHLFFKHSLGQSAGPYAPVKNGKEDRHLVIKYNITKTALVYGLKFHPNSCQYNRIVEKNKSLKLELQYILSAPLYLSNDSENISKRGISWGLQFLIDFAQSSPINLKTLKTLKKITLGHSSKLERDRVYLDVLAMNPTKLNEFLKKSQDKMIFLETIEKRIKNLQNILNVEIIFNPLATNLSNVDKALSILESEVADNGNGPLFNLDQIIISGGDNFKIEGKNLTIFDYRDNVIRSLHFNMEDLRQKFNKR